MLSDLLAAIRAWSEGEHRFPDGDTERRGARPESKRALKNEIGALICGKRALKNENRALMCGKRAHKNGKRALMCFKRALVYGKVTLAERS